MLKLTVACPDVVTAIERQTAEIVVLRASVDAQTKVLSSLTAVVTDIYVLARRLTRPATPENLRPVYKGEQFMPDKDLQIYGLAANLPVDKDVITRHLKVSVDGAVVSDQDYPASTTNFGDFKFPQDSTVDVELVDYDDATPPNPSTPLAVSFPAADKSSPAAPTGLNVTYLGEEQVDRTPGTPAVPVEPVTPDPNATNPTVPTEPPVEPAPVDPAPADPVPVEPADPVNPDDAG